MCDTLENMEASWGIKLYKCGEIFAAPGIDVILFYCNYCEHHFKQISELVHHLIQDHNSEVNKFSFIKSVGTSTTESKNLVRRNSCCKILPKKITSEQIAPTVEEQILNTSKRITINENTYIINSNSTLDDIPLIKTEILEPLESQQDVSNVLCNWDYAEPSIDIKEEPLDEDFPNTELNNVVSERISKQEGETFENQKADCNAEDDYDFVEILVEMSEEPMENIKEEQMEEIKLPLGENSQVAFNSKNGSYSQNSTVSKKKKSIKTLNKQNQSSSESESEEYKDEIQCEIEQKQHLQIESIDIKEEPLDEETIIKEEPSNGDLPNTELNNVKPERIRQQEVENLKNQKADCNPEDDYDFVEILVEISEEPIEKIKEEQMEEIKKPLGENSQVVFNSQNDLYSENSTVSIKKTSIKTLNIQNQSSWKSKSEEYKDKIQCEIEQKHHLQIVESIKAAIKSSRTCKKCNKTFDSPQHLMRHDDCTLQGLIHYKCNYCDHTEISKGRLRQHVLAHPTARPYKCSYCSYASRRKHCMKIHLKLHTGNRPFKCSICNISYFTLPSLNRHRKSHLTH